MLYIKHDSEYKERRLGHDATESWIRLVVPLIQLIPIAIIARIPVINCKELDSELFVFNQDIEQISRID